MVFMQAMDFFLDCGLEKAADIGFPCSDFNALSKAEK